MIDLILEYSVGVKEPPLPPVGQRHERPIFGDHPFLERSVFNLERVDAELVRAIVVFDDRVLERL